MAGIKNSTAIGLFVDGLEIKLAKLSAKKGSIVLEEVNTVQLNRRLEEGRGSKLSIESFSESSNNESNSLHDQGGGMNMDVTGAEDNDSSVLLGLLSQYKTGSYTLNYALSEPSIYYHTLESDFGLTGKKLKKRVIEELAALRNVAPVADSVDYFYSVDRNLVCIIREDGTALIDMLEEVKPYLGKRLPRIPLLESAELALLNLAKVNFTFEPEEIVVIIYIGVEASRLIFMKGSEFLHFAPLITERFDDPAIQNTVYARLMLEVDNLALPRIDKILLAGEAKKVQFDEFVKDRMPEINTQFLSAPYLDVSALPAETQELVPEFAIPIATAWRSLDSKNTTFYQTNLLPEKIRDSQRSFKLGWHGYLLLTLVFLSTIFFTVRFDTLQTELKRRDTTQQRLKMQLAEVDRLKGIIAGIDDEIKRYQVALNVYDSLVPGADRWTKTIERLANGVATHRSLWFTDLLTLPDSSIELHGYALYRSRIPLVSSLFDNTTLTQVKTEPIRQDAPEVYKFIFTAPPLLPPQVKKDTTVMADTTHINIKK